VILAGEIGLAETAVAVLRATATASNSACADIGYLTGHRSSISRIRADRWLTAGSRISARDDRTVVDTEQTAVAGAPELPTDVVGKGIAGAVAAQVVDLAPIAVAVRIRIVSAGFGFHAVTDFARRYRVAGKTARTTAIEHAFTSVVELVSALAGIVIGAGIGFTRRTAGAVVAADLSFRAVAAIDTIAADALPYTAFAVGRDAFQRRFLLGAAVCDA